MATETTRPAGAQRESAFIIGAGVALALIILATSVGIRLSRPGGGSAAAATEVTVTLSEYKIGGTLTAPAGHVVLNVSNGGSMAHNLSVPDLGKATPNIDAGGTAKLDLGEVKEGTYEIDCTVAGHKDAGMTAKLVITAAGATGGDTSGADATTGSGSSGAAVTHSHDQLANGEGTPAEYQALSDAMDKSVNTFVKGEAAVPNKGTQVLQPTVLPDGTKRFDITASIIDWQVEKGRKVKAWAYNGQVPGPTIRVNVGDKVQIHLINKLPMGTDVHLHGVPLQNNADDGVAPLTQKLVPAGGTYDYHFVAQEAAVAMYHAHHMGHFQVINGLFAPLVIGDPGAWLPRGQTIAGRAIPADAKITQEIEMVLNDAGTIGLTLNGKSFPSTDPYTANKGDWFIVNYFNEGVQAHPMHLHQLWQLVIAKDGIPLASPYWMDTLNVAPGERYTVAVNANVAGAWIWHCHILTHVERNEGVFGMATAVIVK